MLTPLLALVAIPGCGFTSPRQVTLQGTQRLSASQPSDPMVVLRRAAEVMGLPRVGKHVLEVRGSDIVAQDFQSDRSYAPFLSDVAPLDYWYDPATRRERFAIGFGMAGFQSTGPTIVSDQQSTFVLRDTLRVPSEGAHAAAYETRALNAWAVIGDWLEDGGVQIAGTCVYRDYPRLVLSRKGARGTERLYVDPKSGFPVKLERVEPHYLWGQNLVEYVYSTWQRLGDTAIPGVSFRVVDGLTNVERNITTMRLVSADSAPSFTMPHRDVAMGYAPAGFLNPVPPDTIRIGAQAFLLKNPGYTELVALARDTVFLFDATQGEARSRADSLWIARLFPGRHAVALVVTDLAWPHIAGVRFWVARGATVYGHHAARAFLDSVVARRWWLEPDALERARSSTRFHFVAVSDTTRVGGGHLLLFAIDGVASEIALAGYLADDRFLWGSDYIQDASQPSMYLDEVCRAVRRVSREPVQVAAEHLAVTPWSMLLPLARCEARPS